MEGGLIRGTLRYVYGQPLSSHSITKVVTRLSHSV